MVVIGCLPYAAQSRAPAGYPQNQYDESSLRNLMSQVITEKNIDDFGRFEKLSKTINMEKAKQYFDRIENKNLQPFEVYIKGQQLLRRFILENGFDINIDSNNTED